MAYRGVAEGLGLVVVFSALVLGGCGGDARRGGLTDGAGGASQAAGGTGGAGITGAAGAPQGGTAGTAGSSGKDAAASDARAAGGTAGSGGTAGASGSGGAAGASGSGGAADGGVKTADAGPPASSDAGGLPPTGEIPAGWVRTLMAVGYGGTRLASQDNGLSWRKITQIADRGGDDQALMRGIAYGDGVWVATGWKIWRAAGGAKAADWQVASAPSGCPLMEGVAYGNGTFVGTCSDDAFVSADGVKWSRGYPTGAAADHVYVVFAKGKFYAADRPGAVFSSSDGMAWQRVAGMKGVAVCNDEVRSLAECPGDAWLDGVYYRSVYEAKIDRSPDGKKWTTVYDDVAGRNGVYRFGAGYLPPLQP